MEKTLDRKIARILADPSVQDFILADAKDADMAAGLAAPGKSPEHHADEGRFRTLEGYRQLMRQNVRSGLLDILLMSASSNEVLTIRERLFDRSPVTPAARANDTTDIHLAMGGAYTRSPSRPFRTATIDHIMCGRVDCAEPAGPDPTAPRGADLGLYSVTFNNDLDRDLESIQAYRAFRLEAERKGFRHFLEVFNPNALQNGPIEDLGRFINDNIVRTLAGVVGKSRPLFLKIPYHGPRAMEQLAGYDRSLIVGILGGSAGTSFDAFHQLAEAKRYGARVALYGRMINNSEHQLTFIQHLRWLADGDLTDPAEAVRSYHAGLEKVGVTPYRSLDEDLQATVRQANYGGGGGVSVPKRPSGEPASASGSAGRGGATAARGATGELSSPDFSRMTPREKIEWNRRRWDRIFGS